MTPSGRNILILAICQALSLAASSTAFTVSILAGEALAADKSLATIPMTVGILSAALVTMPASLLMRRVGRRAGFMLGASIGALGAGLGAAAIHRGSFVSLCLAMVLFGIHSGVAQYHRFAALETAGPSGAGSAIARVLAGGVFGGLMGPEVSKWTVDLLAVRYVGGYLGVMAYLLLIAAIVSRLRMPAPAVEVESRPHRPLAVIARQPVYIVAVMGSAFGYAVMLLLMMSTPLAMAGCGHAYGATASVIQWHIVAMFAPSFLTGRLIGRFGAPWIMLVGVLLQGASVAVALAGLDVAHFWTALLLLGVGWNFLYVGGTTLQTEAYSLGERAASQGLSEVTVATAQVLASALTGWVMARGGWAVANYAALPVLVVIGGTLVWLIRTRRVAAQC